MKKPDTDVILKALIMDSLIARGGKQLTPELIHEISTELLQRMVEVVEDEKKEVVVEDEYEVAMNKVKAKYGLAIDNLGEK